MRAASRELREEMVTTSERCVGAIREGGKGAGVGGAREREREREREMDMGH